MLAPTDRLAAFFSWITGWFNFLGQVAVTTGITFGCANLISTLATVKGGFVPTPGKIIGIYAGLLISHGLINTFGVHILRYLNNSSVIFHSLGVTAFAIAVVAKAPTHQPASFVFSTFYDGTGDPGWATRASPAYVACIGTLMAQYTITGYDASAHLSEETRHASRSAPIGVLTSIGVSAVFGFFLLLCLLFSIQDFDTTVTSSVGQPVLQILLDIFGEDGAIVLFTLVILCVWHCGLFSLCSNSRMMFGFSRGTIPWLCSCRWNADTDNRSRSPTLLSPCGQTLQKSGANDLASCFPCILSRTAIIGIGRGFLCGHFDRDDWSVHLIWYPNPHWSVIPKPLQERAVQFTRLLTASGYSCLPLDRVHYHHILVRSPSPASSCS